MEENGLLNIEEDIESIMKKLDMEDKKNKMLEKIENTSFKSVRENIKKF
jgi:hypothetical protein